MIWLPDRHFEKYVMLGIIYQLGTILDEFQPQSAHKTVLINKIVYPAAKAACRFAIFK